MNSYDAIVIGLGGMGSAALYHLARRGANVLGIEPFGIAHDRGSSHGQTRIIRKSYFEHPDYVPLVSESEKLWEALETESGQRLLHRVGLVLFGHPESDTIQGVQLAAREHAVEIETFEAAEAQRRFTGFAPPEDFVATYEPRAGYLRVEDAVRTHIALSQDHGALCRFGEAIESWTADDRGGSIRTASGTISATKLIFCAGAWTASLIPELSPWLTIRRKPVFWYRASSDCYHEKRGCPIFGFDVSEGFYYGFPETEERGIKIGDHRGGQRVGHPDELQRQTSEEDGRRLGQSLAELLPFLRPEPLSGTVCMYTMSPDEHFIVGAMERMPGILVAAGFSGHGFKFAPAIGHVLADLALDGRTQLPCGFLSSHRFIN